jgi:hypothetical protein
MEQRQFKRWRVVVRCTVGWQNQKIRGLTRNLSYGGAFIATQASIIPPKDAFLTVRFYFAKDEGATENVLSSKIIHTTPATAEKGSIGSFGVKFEEPILKVRDQLEPIFRALAIDQQDN